jgi:uncharacterized protein YkwD
MHRTITRGSRRVLVRAAAALVVVGTVGAALTLGVARPAHAAGTCTPDPAWGTANATFASQVVTLVNQHRQAMGLPALVVSPTLTASADWKSLHMAYYGYMQHDDPAPPIARTVAQRLSDCGYPSGSVGWGENIAYGYQTPQDVMNAWLNSPGHRANIENSTYRAIGVGAARASNGLWYWTQDFGTYVDSGSTSPPPSSTPAPTVSLTSAPASSTTSTSASFAWTTANSPTSVTCSLDGAAASSCASPKSYSGLAAGTHRFVVKVANAGGSNSASYSWTITTSTPTTSVPTVTLTSTPASSTTSTSASFGWTTTNSPTSVTCSLDGAAASSCTSPKAYSGLAAGSHTFVVRVANAAGSSSKSYSWTISTGGTSAGAPTVTLQGAPAASTTSTSAFFYWTVGGSPTSTTCSLDGGAAVACSSYASYSGLSVGTHRFVVRVANAAGSATASWSWTIT